MTAPTTPDSTLYTFGGDEWIVVQLDEAMSVGVNARAQAITRHLAALDVDGVIDICPVQRGLHDPHRSRRARPSQDGRAAPRDRGGGRRRRRRAPRDAHDRDPGVLRGRVDARDAHALPRPPPDAGQDRHRVRGRAQRLRQLAGVHRRDLRCAVHRVDDGLRPRPRLGLPARPRGAPDRGPQVRAAADRHARARVLLGRRVRGDLPGAGRRRLPAARHLPRPGHRSLADAAGLQGEPVPAPRGRPAPLPPDRPRGVRRDPRPRSARAPTPTRWRRSSSSPGSTSTDPEGTSAALMELAT